MYKKKTCILFTNCHGGRIQQILKTHDDFINDYDVSYYRADLRKTPPLSKLRNCSLFIYQYLAEEKWNKLSSDILLKTLPKSCIQIRIPKLSWRVFWPLWTEDPIKTIDNSFPFGRHPYGDSFLIQKTDQHVKINKIIKQYMELDLSKLYNLDKLLDDNYNYLKKEENSKDIDLADYIMDNFREKPLFSVINHPCIDLLYKEVNAILNSISYTSASYSPQDKTVQDWEYNLPIQQSIIQYFNLTFITANSLYYQYGEMYSFSEYATDYLEKRIYQQKHQKPNRLKMIKKISRFILSR